MPQELFSIRVDPDLLEELHNLILSDQRSQVVKTTNEYELHRIEYLHGYIIFYKSGKIVSTSTTAKIFLQKMVENLRVEELEIVIGSDEVGKGEWLGPLVVCAVAISSEKKSKLVAEGVMDSKSLPRERIDTLAKVIAAESLACKKVIIAPERFNTLFSQFRSERKNLNHILAWAHDKAIGDVFTTIPKKNDLRIVVDQFDKNKMEKMMQKLIDAGIKVEQKVRGEDEVAVACASIVAKHEREQWIDLTSNDLKKDLRTLDRNTARQLTNKQKYVKLDYLK